MVFVGVFVAVTASPALADKRVALVMGNGNYAADAFLPHAVGDAAAVGDKLRTLGFLVTSANDQTKSQMLASIQTFLDNAKHADIALFFYGGHGFQWMGENYLMPVDARLAHESDVDLEAVQVKAIVNGLPDGRIGILLLDACRDNPFANRMQRDNSRGGVPDRGLVRLNSPPGQTLIGYATQPGRVASDGSNLHSPFATALIENIDIPKIELTKVQHNVEKRVKELTENTQIPAWDTSLSDDVFLNGIPECFDGRKDGNEADADCGGPCARLCAVGKECTVGKDCDSGVCAAGHCQAPSCTDSVKNGSETDVNCGGGACGACPLGSSCVVDRDCGNQSCAKGVCSKRYPWLWPVVGVALGTVVVAGVALALVYTVGPNESLIGQRSFP